jgi:hypothetical protein
LKLGCSPEKEARTTSFRKPEAATAIWVIRMSQRKRTKEPLPLTTRQGMLLLLALTVFFVIVFYLVNRYLSLPAHP